MRYGIDERDMRRGEEEKRGLYISNGGRLVVGTIPVRPFHFFSSNLVEWHLVTRAMSQSSLVGKSESLKGEEGKRKRLKITVPHFDNTALIKSYSKTLVGRCMNPAEQKMDLLIGMLPKFWKMEDRVVGTDLGFGKFQFHFDEEADMMAVLEMQPFHFDYWMLSLARWKPRMLSCYPHEIPFWIKVVGLPADYWSVEVLQSIGDAIGETTDVDLDYGRIRVVIDSRQELCFDTTIELKGGEFYDDWEAQVSLQFEKLFGFCDDCLSLCHSAKQCPLRVSSPVKKGEKRLETEGRGEDGARSYKGVVLHGEDRQQHMHKEHKEHKGYVGKGKGKMYEEEGSQWTQVPDKRGKRSQAYSIRSRVEEETYGNRSMRRDKECRYERRGGDYRGEARGRSRVRTKREERRGRGDSRI